MVTIIKKPAMVDDLSNVAEDGKAELVEGELRLLAPTGIGPSVASGKVWLSLYQYVQAGHTGKAVPDNLGFIVNLPNRQSFSPDAAYFTGEDPGMKFAVGAPSFAAEIRIENDYGPAAELEMSNKRADYFAAGTLVVWDIDLLSDDVVRAYRSDAPNKPYHLPSGRSRAGEPAVPSWRCPSMNCLNNSSGPPFVPRRA